MRWFQPSNRALKELHVFRSQDYEKSVEVVTLDIIKDKSSMTQVDAAAYKSDKAKRGPLDRQEWR